MRKVFLVSLLLSALTGCALVSAITQMTPKQKAIWLMSTFKDQLTSLQEQGKAYYDAETTDAERKLMRWKMTLLREVLPLIRAYAAAVEAGSTPDPRLEDLIMPILDRLLNAQLGGVPEDAVLSEPPPLPTDDA
jgi:hypothetical protein